MRLDIDVDEMLIELGHKIPNETLELKEPQVKTLKIGLVDLSNLVSIHDLDEEIERLLFRHVQEERGDEEGEALAVADLFVVDRIGLAELVESLLARLVLKVRVARECSVDVA